MAPVVRPLFQTANTAKVMNPSFAPYSMVGSTVTALCLVIGNIWLGILGEWLLIFLGVVVCWGWVWIAGWFNRPSFILMFNEDSKVLRALAQVWAQICHVVTLLAVAGCFILFSMDVTPTNYIPALMIGYQAPMTAMYALIEKNLDDTTGYDTLLNAQILYAALVLCFLLRTTTGTAIYISIGLISLKPIWMTLYEITTRLQGRQGHPD